MRSDQEVLPGKTTQISSPGFLIRTFIAVSIVATILILGLINFGMYKLFQKHNIQEAEWDASSISSTLFNQERELLLPGGRESLHVRPVDFVLLDRHMKYYLKSFGIVKIKVFSREGIIIYSTDPSIIGRNNADNPDLQAALSGQIQSSLKNKEEVMDLAGETRFDVDIVEAYVPISLSSGKIVGSFEVYLDISRYRSDVGSFVRASVAVTAIILLLVLSSLFMLMIHGARQLRASHEYMKELAIKDGLTNLYNRRFLLSRILEEQSRVRRFEVQDPPPATGLIMLDIDHFKKINDTYGHIAGDSILKQLASRVEKNIRAYDILGRYGGEEFLIVAPNTDMQSSIAIGEKICAVVGALPFEVNGKQLDVTISVGVGCMLSSDTDLEKAIKRADAALYEAKAGGRNRVCWTDTPPDRESSEDPVVLPGGEAAESPPATHC